MRTTAILLFFLLVFSSNLLAQTILSGVVTDGSNAPVPFAAVYLSKTTIGTTTNNEGVFSLTIPQEGDYELAASFIGFKSYSAKITASGGKQKVSIKLIANPILLDEITVQSKKKVKNREQNLAQFNALFLGQTENAVDCRILNPEDVYVYTDTNTGLLKGHSLQSLRIENRSLGYLLRYDLVDFTYDAKKELVKFTGSSYFQPLYGNARNLRNWSRRRLAAYYGSKTHFLRSFFTDSLRRDQFQISEIVLNKLTKDTLQVKPIQETNLRFAGNGTFQKLFCGNPVRIKYTDNHPEISSNLFAYQSHLRTSTIQFSDTVKVFKNGFFVNPYAITWMGDMSYERIADMLPYDFQPHPAVAGMAAPVQEVAISPVAQRLLSLQNSTIHDQVFAQLDRNLYKPGDTLFFQAYIRDRLTGSFDTKSLTLYALLFNGKQTLADSARFKISNATASGWMVIPLKAEPGKYHFTAFTGRMQNGDPVEAYQQDLWVRNQSNNPDRIGITFDKGNYLPGDTLEALVRITDPQGNPISGQPFTGSFTIDKTIRESEETHTNPKGESLIRYTMPDTIPVQPVLTVTTKQDAGKGTLTKSVTIPCESRFFGLRFLPEGGNLVEGIIQRVGFNATNLDGEPVAVSGLLKNSAGAVLDTIQSGACGPGSFYCKAAPGLYVEILKGAEKGRKCPLPVPVAKGITLSVEPVDSRSFEVEIQSSEYNGETVTVTGVMNLAQIFSREIILSKLQKFVIETDQLPSGIAGITLFDKNFRPLAERLVFVNSDQHLHFNIQTPKDPVVPGAESDLTITVTDGQGKAVEGFFSVAVTDSVGGNAVDLFAPGIEYATKYHPVFPGNLPASVLARGVDNLTDEERNLLLMVYGWSKINWEQPAGKVADKQFANYDLLNLKILYASQKKLAGRSLDLVSLEGPSVRHLLTDKAGEISLPLDSLPAITRSVMLMPDVSDKNKATGSLLSIPYNEKYFKSNKLLVPQPVLPSEDYRITGAYHFVSLGEKMIEIPEVTITAHTGSKKVFHDAQEEFYQFNNVKSLEPEKIWMSATIEDAIRKLVTPMMVTPDAFYLHAPNSFRHGSVPALFVVDNLPLIKDGWPLASQIIPEDVTSLTVLDGQQGFIRYGEAAQEGVIFINTRSNNPNLKQFRTKWIPQNGNDKMLLPIPLYRPTIEYYHPTKQETEADPQLQNRSTILWEAEQYFSGKEPVRIKYNNLKHEGTVVITINGVSVNNLMGSGKASYLVF